MLIDVKPLYSKAPCPILVTELGMVIEVKPLQQEKVSSSILVKELDRWIDVKPLYLKAPFPILVTEFGMLIDVK